MTTSLERRLTDALAGSPLAPRLAGNAGRFLELRSADAAAAGLSGAVLAGLARVLASQHEVAGFLSRRPGLLERIAHSDADTLNARAGELLDDTRQSDPDDLEACLDELRILRREETGLAAVLDLGRVVSFDAVSRFLSDLAEGITRRALRLALHHTPAVPREPTFAVIGMGKIAGREFTYHSDLDLIFLYEGEVAEIDRFSRIAQRLIHYLGTMTGAGIAYPVDTRLRPSGQQGLLVTSTASFERYQCEQAQPWEHMALLRARPIAGDVETARVVLDRTRRRVVGSGRDAWPELGEMRQRVARERAAASGESIPIKTGRGGLMDVDFLAAGAVLESGAESLQEWPSVAAMLRATAPGKRTEALLADYDTLRVVEARCRWLRRHAVESLDTEPEALACIADLVEPGLPPAALLERVARCRERIRSAFDRVTASGSLAALGAPD
jgi:glutamate-ammonia-ligase adenylyltransferase